MKSRELPPILVFVFLGTLTAALAVPQLWWLGIVSVLTIVILAWGSVESAMDETHINRANHSERRRGLRVARKKGKNQ